MSDKGRSEEIALGVRFRGGATQSLTLPLAPLGWQLSQTSAQVIAEMDALLDEHTDGQIARILNDRAHISGQGKPFHANMVWRLRQSYGLKSRYDRLRDAGMLTLAEVAELLDVTPQTVHI